MVKVTTELSNLIYVSTRLDSCPNSPEKIETEFVFLFALAGICVVTLDSLSAAEELRPWMTLVNIETPSDFNGLRVLSCTHQ